MRAQPVFVRAWMQVWLRVLVSLYAHVRPTQWAAAMFVAAYGWLLEAIVRMLFILSTCV
jgi:hypothetical protein